MKLYSHLKNFVFRFDTHSFGSEFNIIELEGGKIDNE